MWDFFQFSKKQPVRIFGSIEHCLRSNISKKKYGCKLPGTLWIICLSRHLWNPLTSFWIYRSWIQFLKISCRISRGRLLRKVMFVAKNDPMLQIERVVCCFIVIVVFLIFRPLCHLCMCAAWVEKSAPLIFSLSSQKPASTSWVPVNCANHPEPALLHNGIFFKNNGRKLEIW